MQKQERIGIDVCEEVYFAYVVCHEFAPSVIMIFTIFI